MTFGWNEDFPLLQETNPAIPLPRKTQRQKTKTAIPRKIHQAKVNYFEDAPSPMIRRTRRAPRPISFTASATGIGKVLNPDSNFQSQSVTYSYVPERSLDTVVVLHLAMPAI